MEDERELFQIGEIAELTGLSHRTLRYYEELGLLEARSHGPGKFRIYTREDIERINRIKRLKDNLGFSLQQAKEGIERDDERKRLMEKAVAAKTPAAKRKALQGARAILLEELDMVAERQHKLAELEGRLRERLVEVERELGDLPGDTGR
jgi:MerR family transcriptional regulator, repressor of the yfmOP operon